MFFLYFVIYVEKEIMELVPVKGLIGKQFKQDAKIIMGALAKLEAADIAVIDTALSENGYVIYLSGNIIFMTLACKTVTQSSAEWHAKHSLH